MSQDKDLLFEVVLELKRDQARMIEMVELLVAHLPENPEIWLDNQDVMQRFRISERTLKRRRLDGTFPYKKIKGKCYYRLADIMSRFVEKDGL